MSAMRSASTLHATRPAAPTFAARVRASGPLATRTLAITCAFALLAGLGACTEDTPDNRGFAKRPLWTVKDIGEESLAGALLRDDTVLVPGTNHLGGTLAAIDARTGEARWSADDGDPLLGGDGLVAHEHRSQKPIQPTVRERPNGKWDVLIPYRTVADQRATDADEDGEPDPVSYGIAAVAGDTGQLRWASEPMLEIAEPIRSDPVIRAVAAEGGTVLVAANPEGEAGPLTTWALNANTGATRWTEQDVWPSALAGGNAIVEDVPANVTGTMLPGGPKRDDSKVRALDLRDGEPAWDLSDRYLQSTVDVVSGDYLVVRAKVPEDRRGPGDSENATVLLRAGNGKVAERIGDFELCHADGPLIACQPDHELTVFRTDRPELETETSEPFGDSRSWEIRTVIGSTIVVNDRTGDEESLRALDPKGKVLSDNMIAEPVTMNQKYAVFCSKEVRDCGIYSSTEHSPTVRKKDPEPSVDPLAVGEALWDRAEEGPSTEPAPMSRVNDVALTNDAVLYQGELEQESLDATVVADAATGKARWQLSVENASRTVRGERLQLIPHAYALAAIAQTDKSWSLLLSYRSDDAAGVAGLDGADGSVAWTIPLGEPDDDVDVVEAQGDLAYVTVTPDDPESADSQDGDPQPTLSVLDLAERKVLWQSKQGTDARLTSDGIILVSRPDDSEAGQSVTAIDLKDPDRELWTFRDKGGQVPSVHGVFDNLVLIRVADGTAVLDLKSGDELARIGKALFRCDGTARLVACDSSVESGSLTRPGAPVTLRATEDGVRVRDLRGVRSSEVNGVWDGRIFLDATEKRGYRSVDENGVIVDTKLPGRFSGSNEQGIALFTSGLPLSNVSWEVHRLRTGS